MQSQHGYKDGDFTDCPFCDKFQEEDYGQLMGMERPDDGQRRQGSIQNLAQHIVEHMFNFAQIAQQLALELGGEGTLIEYSCPSGLAEEGTS